MSGFVGGASASLNKSITEIMAYLESPIDRPNHNLRRFLHGQMADLAETWFRRGFNRGHRECRAHFRSTGEVPRILEYEGKRTLFTGNKRAVALRSVIKAKPKKVRSVVNRKRQ